MIYNTEDFLARGYKFWYCDSCVMAAVAKWLCLTFDVYSITEIENYPVLLRVTSERKWGATLVSVWLRDDRAMVNGKPYFYTDPRYRNKMELAINKIMDDVRAIADGKPYLPHETGQ